MVKGDTFKNLLVDMEFRFVQLANGEVSTVSRL
jgi:hypothetical protein